ncbi:hypothetical protein SD71_17850 [Cohnella kolymensis]|uniref:Uncharacterized protein n=1 Tax=Cohnella kolymensis TaxID=1590652 RepID=A0ABR5A1K6_9BACL|nr:hypothetical protein [Cohnella kolymensis]KIL34865.1 hypothetical protein SD71_17850 [Cohnella kolymensis]
MKVGSQRVEAQYAAKEPAEAEPSPPANAYQQQDLVAFYHTVFLPYREFQNDWFAALNDWLADPAADRSASMKELSKSAEQKYTAIKRVQVPQISPLLKDAQNSYLKSLKLFKESFDKGAAQANQGPAAITMDKLNADAYFKEARSQSLAAQKNYYDAMLKWAASVNLDIDGEFKAANDLEVTKWKSLPLIIKLKVTADYLADHTLHTPYLPHDLTARVDQFISSGQSAKKKLKTFDAIAELMTSTEAVRNGDFLEMKARFYGDQQLPQLPFFFPDK